jgi:hypothetical protein
VSQKAEKNLKLGAYLIKHWTKCISWPCKYDAITLDNVCSMILIREFDEMYENHKPPDTRDVWDPAKSREQLDNHLCFKWRNEHSSCVCDARTGCAEAGK